MTAIQFVAQLLEADWEPSVTNRSTDVPEPLFVEEKDEAQSNLRTHDTAHVTDGGDLDLEYLGFGVTHKGIDALVTVQLRTADRRENDAPVNGRHRLFGERPAATTSADRHAGLAGETLRILESYRHGVAEFDRVIPGPVRDQSDLTGVGHYRADLDVALVTHAEKIDTSV